jgi:hypothetical protein
MLARFTVAAAAVFACAGLAAAEPPAPAVVVQVKPVTRVLSDLKEMMRQVGGKAMGDELIKEFERDLKRSLGEKGFEGLDINRPIAMYGVLTEKPEDISFVLLVPVTDEKEFVEFLGRIEIKAEAVKDKKGLYTITVPPPLPKASHLRFSDGGWAYITLNDGEPTDPKNLIPVGELLKNADPALISAKMYPGRVPAKLATMVLDQIDEGLGGFKGFVAGGQDPAAKFLRTYLEQFPKLIRRYTETALKEVEEIGVTLNFDAASGSGVAEMTIVPKAGTPTAREFAAIGPTTNRFAGLVGKDAAFGVTIKAPLFAAEVREVSGAAIDLIDAGLKQAKDVPEKLRPVLEEVTKGFHRSVKAEKLDAAIALVGPDKGGKFVFVAGLSFDDTAALEKAMRDAAKDSGLAKEFEFDAAKVGDVSIHKVPLMRLFPEDATRELTKVFGDKPTAYLAFAKDAIFLTFGSNALDTIKAAVAAKPGPAPALDVAWNSGRIQKFVATMDERAGVEFAKILGVDDKAESALSLTVQGGQSLKVKVSLNVRYLPKLLMVGGASARADFGAVPPPPVAIPIKN